MNAPILYVPNFVSESLASGPDSILKRLKDDLEWERREDANRCEYYCNEFNASYQYGRGKGVRIYYPKPFHGTILDLRNALRAHTPDYFEMCFLNRYLNQSDHLGWHADDSPEIDHKKPIAIVSLGVEREIWFRPIRERKKRVGVEAIREGLIDDVEKLQLAHGSLCLMAAGMQQTWEHRIPKASFQCGERISLTFRGYSKGET